RPVIPPQRQSPVLARELRGRGIVKPHVSIRPCPSLGCLAIVSQDGNERPGTLARVLLALPGRQCFMSMTSNEYDEYECSAVIPCMVETETSVPQSAAQLGIGTRAAARADAKPAASNLEHARMSDLAQLLDSGWLIAG